MDRRWCARVTSIRTINRHLLNHSMALFLLILWWPRKSKSNQSRPLVMPRVVFLDLSFLLLWQNVSYNATCNKDVHTLKEYCASYLETDCSAILIVIVNSKLQQSPWSWNRRKQHIHRRLIKIKSIGMQRLKSREAGRQVVRRLRWAVSRGAV